ncbi:hypothetical protein VPLG_00007 [Vibrio phage eugene 12A10]|uniref:hypothetical protein n=1 Tax=Vibrio phage eugene 12A10 TaxID=573172 RepID=UPI000351E459|nr:hypothetical protein VPLG_00007 [Vibrio phage eugene 12A10]AGN51446.1 hypothetical protein VPLG_00007 [Vibrio phage eugene 12A10]
MKKYRIKHCKYDNGKEEYTIQHKAFGLFYVTTTKCMGLYDRVETYDTLNEAVNVLLEYEKIPSKLVNTYYIYNNKGVLNGNS